MNQQDENFVLVSECPNPMEAELLPAVLREREIPHRTEWGKEGTLRIFVLADFADDARAALEEGRRVFFPADGAPAALGIVNREIDDRAEIEEWPFGRRERQPAEEIRKRPVWPAWLLAAVPGLGLGHLYAGKFQIFIFLVFASLLGFLLYNFNRSPLAFVFPIISWAADLGFAAFHVREHNRRVERLEMRERAAREPSEDRDAEQP